MNRVDWLTIEELAKATGFSIHHLRLVINRLYQSQVLPSNLSPIQGAKNRKYYHKDVLQYIKKYQIITSIPNATKNKLTALTGNISYLANKYGGTYE